MGRSPRKDNHQGIKKGTWTPEEDRKLIDYIRRYGIWNWSQMPKFADLSRSGKSCRLRWLNYLCPDVKRGNFTEKEVEIIISMYQKFGSRWSLMAKELPGRTDNEIKNYWHTRLKKILFKNNLVPNVHDESAVLVSSTDEYSIQESPRDEINTTSLQEGNVADHHGTSSSTKTLGCIWDTNFYASIDDDYERRSKQLETAFAKMNIGDHDDLMNENYLCMEGEEEEEKQIRFLVSDHFYDQFYDQFSCFYNDVYCDILFNFPEKIGTIDFEEPYFW